MFAAVPFEQKVVAPRLPDGVFHDPNGPAVLTGIFQFVASLNLLVLLIVF